MRLAFVVTGSALLLGVAACSPTGGTTATGTPAMGTTSTAPRAASQMPQPANSLPSGATVSAPVATTTGVVGRASP